MTHNHGHEEHSIAALEDKISIEPNASWLYASQSTLPKVMEWENVSLDYEGKPVIEDVTAWIHQGELTCICGANGAGKTQLLRLGLGIVQPKKGIVRIFGEASNRARNKVGYVPQLKAFNRSYPASVDDVLVSALRGRWPLRIRNRERDVAAGILEKLGGLQLLGKDVGTLSGGELQRVFLARALITAPKILVLDEPMAAVDSKGRAGMIDLLAGLRASEGLTIILITHSDVLVDELSDRVMFLEKGRLVGWGTPSEVMSIESLKEVAFFGHDHEAALHSHEG